MDVPLSNSLATRGIKVNQAKDAAKGRGLFRIHRLPAAVDERDTLIL